MNSVNQVQSETCSICASPMHTTQMCPSTVSYPDFYIEQANALNNYGKPFASPFSKTYVGTYVRIVRDICYVNWLIL